MRAKFKTLKLIGKGIFTVLLVSGNSSFSKTNEPDSQWEKLLFYEKGESLIDDPQFFMARDGQISSKNEYEANLKVLQGDDIERQKFACSFPARYQYFKARKLVYKSYHCPQFTKWLDSFDANGISIIFASQYLENPASSFGHTFLKINSSKRSFYLNKIISFSATVPEDIGAVEYVYKGVFGGYKGYFSSDPLYIPFHEYGNMERRDLWEYELKISSSETKLLLSHLYELINRGTVSYAFLNRNCSGMLLKLISYHKELKEVENLPLYLLPIEAVKILKDNHLIVKRVYHPSLTSRLETASKRLKQDEEIKLRHFIQGSATLSPDDSIEIHEAAIEFLNLQRQMNGGEFNESDKEKFAKTLVTRASKGEAKKWSINDNDISPENGPDPRRLSIGKNVSSVGQWHSVFGFRPLGKDFMDPPNGYTRESEVNFFKTELELHNNQLKDIAFEIDIVGVKKYTDYNFITRDESWGANVAVKRYKWSNCPSCYFAEIDSYFGLGKSFKESMYYAVLHPAVQMGNLSEHLTFNPYLELGIIRSTKKFVLKSSYSNGYYLDKDDSNSFSRLNSIVSYFINESFSVQFRAEWWVPYKYSDFKLTTSFYF